MMNDSASPPPPALCERSMKRFVLFPIQYDEAYAFAKRCQALTWTSEAIDLAGDVHDWKLLSEPERTFLTHVLAFFAAADGIVNENISVNFQDEFTAPEVRMFYAFQTAMECVHMETYGLLIQTYLPREAERQHVFNAIETMPAVRRKAEWAMKWMNRDTASLAERLIAFVAVEGISFSGSFCCIFWFKKMGKMPGLCFANELISRDEGLHCEFGMLMYRLLNATLPDARIHEIFRGAVEAEVEFITAALSCELIGMNAALMTQYVQAVANVMCKGVNAAPLYPGVDNPFDWMTLIDIHGKTNFFERRVSEYAQANVGFAVDHTLITSAEF